MQTSFHLIFEQKRKALLVDNWALRNEHEFSQMEMFIHFDKVSGSINPDEARVDARCSVMRE